MKIRTTIVCAVAALSFTVGSSLVASATTAAQPPASVGVATTVSLTSAVKNAHFLNQNGAAETLGGLKGKTIFVVPLLTLCGDTCPFTSGNLLQLANDVKSSHLSNVDVVAISVDPYRDTVKRIKAYANLIGANFQIWTPAGSTTRPVAPMNSTMANMNGAGTGGTNPNLTPVEKLFAWTVQVVDQGTPPSTDWMAPHEKLTYDINHSDGFWVINAGQQVRFVSGTKPRFTGTLAKALATFMGYKSNIYKSAVYKGGWTPAEALQAIEWV